MVAPGTARGLSDARHTDVKNLLILDAVTSRESPAWLLSGARRPSNAVDERRSLSRMMLECPF